MKTKLILIITTIIISSCATPNHCYGDTLTIYSVDENRMIEMEIETAERNIQMGTDIAYMGYGFIAMTHLTTMLIPANIENGLFVPVDNIRFTSMITGGITALVGQRIVWKNKKRKKRLARLK